MNDDQKECCCSPEQVSRYRNKVSGPMLDRIDLHIYVPRPAVNILAGEGESGDSSSTVRARVNAARAVQLKRGTLNRNLSPKQLTEGNLFSDESRELLCAVANKKSLSARSWFSALRVARTIADLEGVEEVQEQHMAEAVNFRVLTHR